jgi:translation initiation factor 3 subunit E
LASEILVQNWETALEDVNKLREYIDSNVIGNSLQVLQQRTWLIHWSLFVFFNHVKGRDLIIEMFLYRPQYVKFSKAYLIYKIYFIKNAIIV